MENKVLSHLRTPLSVATVMLLIWAILGVVNIRQQAWGEFRTNANNTIVRVFDGSPASAAGFQIGDAIRSSDGIAVNKREAQARRGRPAIDETRVFEVERDGNLLTLELSYTALPLPNTIRRCSGILMGLLFLCCGVWAFMVAPGVATALLAGLGVFFSPMFSVGPYFASPVLRNINATISGALGVLGVAFLVHFFAEFPKPKRILERRLSIWGLYGPAVLLGLIWFWVGIVTPYATNGLNAVFPLFVLIVVLGYLLTALIGLVHSYVRATSKVRSAAGLNLLLAAVAVGIGPPLLGALVSLIAPQFVIPGSAFLPLSVSVIPVALAIAAVRGGRAASQAGVVDHRKLTDAKPQFPR